MATWLSARQRRHYSHKASDPITLRNSIPVTLYPWGTLSKTVPLSQGGGGGPWSSYAAPILSYGPPIPSPGHLLHNAVIHPPLPLPLPSNNPCIFGPSWKGSIPFCGVARMLHDAPAHLKVPIRHVGSGVRHDASPHLKRQQSHSLLVSIVHPFPRRSRHTTSAPLSSKWPVALEDKLRRQCRSCAHSMTSAESPGRPHKTTPVSGHGPDAAFLPLCELHADRSMAPVSLGLRYTVSVVTWWCSVVWCGVVWCGVA